MNIEYLSELIVPIIVAGALCIGFIMKKWLPTDDKWIPTVLAILGAVCGVIIMGLSVESIVMGMLSALAATGLHQAFKQHFKLDIDADELYSRGPGDETEVINIDAFNDED